MLLKNMDSEDHNYCFKTNFSDFTRFINNGKLHFPAEVVLNIVKYTEKVFRAEINMNYMGKKNFKHRITVLVLQYFITSNVMKMFQPTHPIVDMHEELHELQVIKFIVSTYSDIRIQTHAKKKTIQLLGDKANLRTKLHKTILFYHI